MSIYYGMRRAAVLALLLLGGALVLVGPRTVAAEKSESVGDRSPAPAAANSRASMLRAGTDKDGGASAGAAATSREQQSRPLRMGLLPYLSPSALMKTWSPLVSYLERHLQRRIIVSTAPDFATYIRRAAEGRYDLYQTAPHFAAFSESRQHYRRLARLSRELDGNIVVVRDAPYRRIEDLRGAVFATPDRLAVITLLGESALLKHGLSPHRNVTMKYTPSHNNAMLAVVEGQADAAVTSAAVYERMPPEVKNRLRVLAKTERIPHMMFMANPRLTDGEYAALKAVLLRYSAAGAGREFFTASGYGDMAPITDGDMARLAPLLPLLEKRQQE